MQNQYNNITIWIHNLFSLLSVDFAKINVQNYLFECISASNHFISSIYLDYERQNCEKSKFFVDKMGKN